MAAIEDKQHQFVDALLRAGAGANIYNQVFYTRSIFLSLKNDDQKYSEKH
jgi:hypothetical protein